MTYVALQHTCCNDCNALACVTKSIRIVDCVIVLLCVVFGIMLTVQFTTLHRPINGVHFTHICACAVEMIGRPHIIGCVAYIMLYSAVPVYVVLRSILSYNCIVIDVCQSLSVLAVLCSPYQ